jgi:hypothetical protein
LAPYWPHRQGRFEDARFDDRAKVAVELHLVIAPLCFNWSCQKDSSHLVVLDGWDLAEEGAIEGDETI